MASGARHSLRIVRELVRGTTPANPAFKYVRHTGTSLGMSKETLQSEELRDDRQIADVRHGARQVAGDINFELSYGSFDLLLEAALMGAWDVDGGGLGIDRLAVGVQRHYHTVERYFGDLAAGNKFMRFTGVEVNTLELAVNANAMITGTFGLIGKDMNTFAAAVAGATYDPVSTTAPLDSFTGTINDDGVPIAVITELTVSLANGLEQRYVVGDKTSIDPSVARSNVNLNVTAYFESMTLLDKFINEVESDINFTLPDAAGNLYTFVFPRVKYNGGQPDLDGEGPITLSMPVQALLDPVTGTNFYIDRNPA